MSIEMIRVKKDFADIAIFFSSLFFPFSFFGDIRGKLATVKKTLSRIPFRRYPQVTRVS